MNEARRRRSSTRITLVLIGAASVTSCGDPAPVTTHRDVYENRTQCVQDWGDEKKCEVVTNGTHRGYYYGPSYTIGHDGSTTPRRTGTSPATAGAARDSRSTSRPIATQSQSVARSGFGSSSRSFSSGS